MIPILAFIAGCAYGWLLAGKRGGNRLDKLQYAVGFGIAFFLGALTLGILADLTGVV